MMNRTIKLPLFNIIIELFMQPGAEPPSGTIVSTLCDNEVSSDSKYRVATDVLESFILAAACSGVEVESSNFLEAIISTAEQIENRFGDE